MLPFSLFQIDSPSSINYIKLKNKKRVYEKNFYVFIGR